jgi:adenine-specific DNA-methyltransferase
MNPTVRKVAGILTSDFSMNNYVDLTREIFSTVKIVAPDSFHKEYSNFSSHVDGSYHVGLYQSPDDKKIAVFAVQLQKQSFVENSRSTQRSYAKKLIENGNCDAALIAYYTPGDPKWRLSFVRLDFEMKLENGKLKASENITPAKRYSYLVGKDEPCHTAIDRFHKFIADNNSEPTMAELEEAFSVEAVTNEFFQLYCEKFYQLSDWLTKNEDFLAEAERCGFTVEQYAKKLLGQIVFLYFLQKKGWLGVGVWSQEISEKEYKNIFFTPGAQGRIIKQYLPQIYIQKGDKYVLSARALDQIPDDAEEMIANHVPGERHWGSGSKTFLRTLFKFSQSQKKHFFDNYLEPLFYDTLNRNRGRLGYSCFLHCRIPFLSGGLFEPLDGYDWKSCNFDIPDEIFSNKKFDEDLEGDGILDIFDRYNFTMSEDEPMEREVAIDPEMLGKVFENLLDVKDRKSKGAFYTPREIVHYMCQESLINYLSTNSHISEDAIRDFILYGDFYKDIDTEKTLRTTDEDGKTHYEIDPAKPMKISEEIFNLSKGVNNLKVLDDLLANIRVADPAVGSGAFPLGMLNEVVRARQNLSAYMAIGMNAYDTRLMYTLERSPYMLKYTTIKNCIFAADIEPSAVDIARLRLWLSLVIDDEINPNAQNSFEGHQNPSPLPNLECNIVCGNSLVDEFEGTPLINNSTLIGTLGQLDFNSASFESILPKLIDAQDRLFRCDDPVKKEDIKVEVSNIKDMLIHSQIALMSDEKKQRYYKSKNASSKPYVLWQVEFANIFYEKGGFDVVIGNPPYGVHFSDKEKSYLKRHYSYSIKGKFESYRIFMELSERLGNAKAILSYVVPNTWMSVEQAINLRETWLSNNYFSSIIQFPQKSFKATVDTIAYVVQKGTEANKETRICIIPLSEETINIDKYLKNNFHIRQQTWYDSPKHLIIFGSDKQKRDLIDKVTKNNSALGSVIITKQGLIPYLTKEEGRENKYISDHPADATWKKYFDGSRCIDRYGTKGKISYIKYGDWLYAPREQAIFCQPRIVFQLIRNISLKQRIVATYIEEEIYSDRNTGIILAKKPTISLKYILGLLNSKLYNFIHANSHQSTYISFPSIEALPYVDVDEDTKNNIIRLVDEILEAHKNNLDSKKMESEIDKIIYSALDLNQNEIALIEER